MQKWEYKDHPFNFTMSNSSVGYNIPFTFLPLYTNNLRMDPKDTSNLISLIGLANTLGRITFGFIADDPKLNRLVVYSICLTCCGIATSIVGFFDEFWSLAIYALVFGFTTGAFVVLTSVIVVDLLGLDKLANGFGLILFFQGTPTFFGQPAAAFLNSCFDKSYTPAFLLAGICIFSGGFILNLIPMIQQITRKKQAVQKFSAV
jgi:MFS family permease